MVQEDEWNKKKRGFLSSDSLDFGDDDDDE
jgi:hypothetical protein